MRRRIVLVLVAIVGLLLGGPGVAGPAHADADDVGGIHEEVLSTSTHGTVKARIGIERRRSTNEVRARTHVWCEYGGQRTRCDFYMGDYYLHSYGWDGNSWVEIDEFHNANPAPIPNQTDGYWFGAYHGIECCGAAYNAWALDIVAVFRRDGYRTGAHDICSYLWRPSTSSIVGNPAC